MLSANQTRVLLALVLSMVCSSAYCREKSIPPPEVAEKRRLAKKGPIPLPDSFFKKLDETDKDDAEARRLIVIEYAETMSALTDWREGELSDEEKYALAVFLEDKNMEKIKDITYKVSVQFGPTSKLPLKERVEKYEKLAIISSYLLREEDAEKVRRENAGIRHPTKEEEEAIEKLLVTFKELYGKKKYGDLLSQHMYVPQDWSNERKKQYVEYMEKGMAKYAATHSPVPMLESLLEKRGNWFVYGQGRGILVRETADAQKVPEFSYCLALRFDFQEKRWRFIVGYNRIDPHYQGEVPELK